MVSKVEQNKRKKEKSLYTAAYDLFTSKGINDTSINEIVREAGVGKGTFYLYFKDKYDILDRIILHKSSEVLCEAISKTREQEFVFFEDQLLFFIDYIIEFFKEDRLMLKLIHKNLSWGVLKRASRDYDEVHEIYLMFEEGYRGIEISEDRIQKILFIIMEMVGSVSYSAIILNEPSSIDEMKPILFDMVRKII